MTDLAIQLAQIEKSDLTVLSTLLDAGFKKLLPEDYIFSNIDTWFLLQNNDNTQSNFSIKAKKVGSARTFLVGMCGIREIDWIARHGKLLFFMVDKDAHQSTMQNYPATKTACRDVLAFAFDNLNLNKVWIEVLETNDIKDSLEYFGFVAEGIRRASIFRDGKFLNTILCSLTYEEYCDKVER